MIGEPAPLSVVSASLFLHDDVAPAAVGTLAGNHDVPEFRKPRLPERTRSLPNRNLHLGHVDFFVQTRFALPPGEAVSKKSSSASRRFARASSMVYALGLTIIVFGGPRATIPIASAVLR